MEWTTHINGGVAPSCSTGSVAYWGCDANPFDSASSAGGVDHSDAHLLDRLDSMCPISKSFEL